MNSDITFTLKKGDAADIRNALLSFAEIGLRVGTKRSTINRVRNLANTMDYFIKAAK